MYVRLPDEEMWLLRVASFPYYRTVFLLHLENGPWVKVPQFPSTEVSYEFGKDVNRYTDDS